MKIATWNVNSLRVRLPQVLEWLNANPVDALALQETKTTDDGFPFGEFEAAGYNAIHNGQKTYNGVAIISPHELLDVTPDMPGFDEQKRLISATVNAPGSTFRFICAYVVNGQAVGSDKYDYKLRWLDALHAFITAEMQTHKKLAVVGDYNIAPDDRDVYDAEEWHEKVLCSTPERERFNKLLGLGLTDALRAVNDEAELFTWWDYRQAAFRRNRGMRIDHILLSKELTEGLKQVEVDKTPRRNERPSDHTPVVAEIICS